MLSLTKLSVSTLRLAIEQVLTIPSYRKNAQKIQQSIQQAGGVKQAANIIEQVTQSQTYQVVEASNSRNLKTH
ncbi:hypothetical protein AMR41_28465 [Hapalosiphon sp. MRB220]|nr:hypothetical protein AMR41_28465 [Hapalosiphon sp. MRB220]